MRQPHVELSNHPSDSGVKQPESPAILVTSTFKNKIPLTDSLQQGNDNPQHKRLNPPLPTDPFRGEVEPSNHPSDTGVKQPESPATVVTSTFENPIKTYTPRLPYPFRGNAGPPDHPSDSGVEEETLEESLKTLDAMITSYCKPQPKTETGPQKSLTYSQELKKRLAQARAAKKK